MFRHYCVILRELVVSTQVWQMQLLVTQFKISHAVQIPMFKIFKILNFPIYNEMAKIILLLSFT